MESLENDLWENVLLRYRGAHGSKTVHHSHRGELKELTQEIREGISQVQKQVEERRERESEFEIEGEEVPEIDILPRPLTQKLVALFIISSGIMDEQLHVILRDNIIAEPYRSRDQADDWIGKYSFNEKIELAYDMGLIESGTHGLIHDVRKTRNSLVHDPTDRLVVDSVIQSLDRINKARKAPEKLHELRQELQNNWSRLKVV